jgi:hypothetical protein
VQYRDSSTVDRTDLIRRIISLNSVASRISTSRSGVEQSILFALVIAVWGILLYEALLATH